MVSWKKNRKPVVYTNLTSHIYRHRKFVITKHFIIHTDRDAGRDIF